MTSYLNFNKPIVVQVELTTKCNAMCPMCARVDDRTDGQYLNPYMPHEADMQLETWQNFFDSWTLNKVGHIDHTPVFGDPLASNTFMLSLEHIARFKPSIDVHANTNASLRTTDYWKELASVMSFNKENWITFSIDGLADTNHLYRRMTNFDKIMDNANAFISAGGNAHWKMIEFEHNKHQIEEAREIARKMGFTHFTITPNYGGRELTSKDKIKTYQQPSTLKNYEDDIGVIEDWKIDHQNRIDYFNNLKIRCEWKGYNSIFLATNGEIFPCCHTYRSVYSFQRKEAKDYRLKINKVYGANNVNENSTKEILENKWYDKDLVDSFGQNLDSENNPKLHRCAVTCGISQDRGRDLNISHTPLN
jgi:MoaA/NifB/PqqE/SkfB family radical SAM enzyme